MKRKNRNERSKRGENSDQKKTRRTTHKNKGKYKKKTRIMITVKINLITIIIKQKKKKLLPRALPVGAQNGGRELTATKLGGTPKSTRLAGPEELSWRPILSLVLAARDYSVGSSLDKTKYNYDFGTSYGGH